MRNALFSVNLDGYFARIGHVGPLSPDLATLGAIIAGHAISKPSTCCSDDGSICRLRRSTPSSSTAGVAAIASNRTALCSVYSARSAIGWSP